MRDRAHRDTWELQQDNFQLPHAPGLRYSEIVFCEIIDTGFCFQATLFRVPWEGDIFASLI